MSWLEKAQTSWIQTRLLGRIAPNMPGFLPSGRWSASRLLEKCAARHGESIGIAFEDRQYTWREVNSEANRWAHFFTSLGIGPGDTVALLLDNRPEYLFALSGLNRLKAIAALINTNINGKGLIHALEIANATVCIVGSEHAEKLAVVTDELKTLPKDKIFEQAIDPQPTNLFASADDAVQAFPPTPPDGIERPRGSDPMCYIYTSGTTGLPKAAIIKNLRWFAASTLFGRGLLELTPGEMNYVALPLYHSNAMFAGWGAALTTGGGIALRRKFSASQFWADVRHFRATSFIYIGELLRYLMNQAPSPEDREHTIRVIAGNGLRPDIWQKFSERFGIQQIREFYGATEGNGANVNLENRVGMVGRLLPGQRIVKCDLATGEVERNTAGFCEDVEVGETGLLITAIGVTTPFDGYADKKATEKKILVDVFQKGDRCFNSGDLLSRHENKWLAFVDRVGDTFRWKGENVSTNEVAETLNDAPGVLESNVYGVPVPGADGRAGMASLNCSAEFSLPVFADFVRENLPIFQRPYFLRIQQEMRITGTFKHQKVDYQKEGYDPSLVDDPLYFLAGDIYEPVDAATFAAISSGEQKLR
ncbi:MAG: long-chain-acyl-CoA synthetase [Myxococcota bacterium]|nr:long-chain-acyl-CoA synthetase [Myxococcota bacterium]